MSVTTVRGRTFVRGVIAKAATEGGNEAIGYAETRWSSSWAPVVKAMTGSITTDDTGNVEAQEFFGTVADRSLLGQLTGLRRIPFNVRYMSMSQGTRGYWVSPHSRIPVSKPALAGSSLERLKVASLAIFTRESIEAAGPLAESAFQADLTDAVTLAIDAAFIDRASAGAADESPASVTHGATAIAATNDAGADVKSAIQTFAGDLTRAFWVTDGKTAASLGLVRGTGGSLAFPNVGARGGEILGIPVVTTDGSPHTQAAGGQLALVDPTGIAFNTDGIEVAKSTNAAIWVSDTPDSDPTQVSLFQEDSVALKVVAWASWEQQRENGVVVITGCKY